MAIDKITTAAITDGTITSSDLAAGAVQNQSAFKNIVINGDMNVSQRSTSVSSITSSSYNTVDRFQTVISGLGTWTQSQGTDVPTGQGFATSLKMDCTTADASPSASDLLIFRQRLEGQNLQYIKKGTSNAESLTLSFWVKSNKTGTYICELLDSDNSNRHINKSYTIDTADTWEKKTVTFAGDTTGTLNNDNGVSLDLGFWLGAGTTYTSGTLQTSWGANTSANRAVGQVNLADSTSNNWYVTGVQVEAGTSASDFEFLPVDVNLERCNRYFQIIDAEYFVVARWRDGNGAGLAQFTYPKTMRAPPSVSFPGTWSTGAGYTGTPSANNIQAKCFAVTGGTISSNEIQYAHSGNFQMDAEL